MVPAGEATERMVWILSRRWKTLSTAAIFTTKMTCRAGILKEKGIHYIDVGTRRGLGLEGCCHDCGEKESVEHLNPIFKTIAPGQGTSHPRLDANT